MEITDVKSAMEFVYAKEKNLAVAAVIKTAFNEVLKKLTDKPGIGETIKGVFS